MRNYNIKWPKVKEAFDHATTKEDVKKYGQQ